MVPSALPRGPNGRERVMRARESAVYLRFGRPLRRRLRSLRLSVVGVRIRLRGNVVVNERGVKLTVLPSDRRAQRLELAGGLLARNVAATWQTLILELQPDLIIDVGANYGEVTLSSEYPDGSRVHVVEANSKVALCLRDTLRREAPLTVVHEGAASDRTGTMTFHVSSDSSGLSSLARPATKGHPEIVNTFRLDERIGDVGESVLVKLDVEGHEMPVIDGLHGLLSKGKTFAILCEPNPEMLESVDRLLDTFSVQFTKHGGEIAKKATRDELIRHMADWQSSPYSRDIVVRPASFRA
jgi:FkbM family methyltransferase